MYKIRINLPEEFKDCLGGAELNWTACASCLYASAVKPETITRSILGIVGGISNDMF